MTDVQDIDDLPSLHALVIQDLKELGIKIPKAKKSGKGKDDSSLDISKVQSVFGNYLENVPSVIIEPYGSIPKFLVDAAELIERHADTEGLFRKSGSVARQKELKQRVEDGCGLGADAHPLDVAGLLKQFLRELPDPLLTYRLHDSFVRCHSLPALPHPGAGSRRPAILLTSLLLPPPYLSTLRFTARALNRVAASADIGRMDAHNLAVCLAPNVLRPANSSGNGSGGGEARLLAQQTGVVATLIEAAADIGMVSTSLRDRTALMAGCCCCFASEDELDRDTSCDKTKKKKKRSGSFQGLVSNLSSSFSKWRRNSAGNSSQMSDKSCMSMMNADRSSFVSNTTSSNETLASYNSAESVYVTLGNEVTPKMVRKRKADGDTVPFSANKKKAILQNMPCMSTLGSTPFTPALRKGKPADFQDIPRISFVDDPNMVFSATPSQNADSSSLSPCSLSRSKSVRQTPCKTPKSGMRKVKGFFRRLSGSKDISANDTTADIPDKLTIVQPPAATNRQSQSLYRNHRKTPSSPARLVSSLQANVSSNTTDTTGRDISEIEDGIDMSSVDLLANVTSRSERQRGSSADGSLSTSLRRGRPNTIKSGLPSPCRVGRRSMEPEGRFVSPEKCELLDSCGPCALDTSPILRDAPPAVSVMTPDNPLTPDNALTPDNTMDIEEDATAVEQTVPDDMVDDMSRVGEQVMFGHDDAFIHESMLCAADQPLCEPAESFASPVLSAIQVHGETPEVEPAGPSDGSQSSPVLPTRLVSEPSASSLDSGSGGTPDSRLGHSMSRHSVRSYDSGIDCSVAERVDRLTSPLRFPASPLRRAGSPLRVLNTFNRTGSVRRPILPISTDLLRTDSVCAARNRLGYSPPPPQAAAQGMPGNTPCHLGALQAVEITERTPLRERNSPCGPTATPKIKPQLLTTCAGKRLLGGEGGKKMLGEGVTPRRARNTPMKPIKRLHGSPRSPYANRSPLHCTKSPVKAIAPPTDTVIPTHVTDWDI